MQKSKKLKFENKLERLREIVSIVEDIDTPLDEAISLYKEGIAVAKECGEALRGYEEQVLLLKKTADEFVLEPFDGVS
ncbi:MAG: exodeoxyribonuclease VII small subunit [Clostridiales bacterium]|nr:exodeoxyribonuclease VII small subunit [Clostridiales bacterium]